MTSKNRPAGKNTSPAEVECEQLASLFNTGRHAELESLAQQLIASYPDSGFVWMLLGLSFNAQGKDALPALRKAAALSPDNAEIHNNLGNALRERGLLDEAISSCRHALKISPEFAMAHNNLGNALRDQGQVGEAVDCYRRAVAIRPDYVVAHANLGAALRDLGRLDEAMASCRRALEIDPKFAMAHNSLGNVVQDSGQLEAAVASYRRALELIPGYVEAHNSLATALHGLGQFEAALASVCRALEISPGFVDAYNNQGLILRDMGRHDEAVSIYRKALELDPGLSKVWNNLGVALQDLGRLDEALASYRRALELDPAYSVAHGNLLFALNYHSEKSGEEIFSAYREYDERYGIPHQRAWRAHSNLRMPGKRLKLGYVSPDFRQHSCRYFLEPLLSHHAKSEVEVTAYAELSGEDPVTRRYQGYVDHWVVTTGLSDDALAERIRADGIDILIDLAGHTDKNRLGVFARKPAPVQASWLGYGYTTGLSAIDYLLTDSASAPAGSEHLFSEQPWRLPSSCYAFRPAEGMGEPGPLPAERKGRLTYGTLTRAIRINERVIRVWSEVLKRVEGSHLVIDSGNYREAAMQQHLRDKFAAHGISPERLEIGYHTPPWETLRSIDIGLDCFPHNSGTTLFETLYMGIPYVTLAGRPSVGRLGGSILHGVGHPEWIAQTEEEYIEKAVGLAMDLEKLAGLRAGLRQEMRQSALMDETGFARKVETAYRQMWENWCASGADTKRPAAEPPLASHKARAAELARRDSRQETAEERSQLFNLFNAGRYGGMESLARRLIERYPESGLAWKGLSVALQAQGQEALAELRRTVELLPEDADAHNNLGNALRNAGRFEAAQASYRRALEINPDFADAHYNLGNTLQDIGLLQEALASYRRSLELNPGFAEAHNNLGNVLKKIGQLDSAIACFQRASALKPESPEMYNSLGNALLDGGVLDDALDNYRRALALKPDYAEACSNLLFALNYHPGKSDEEMLGAARDYEAAFGMPLRAGWRPHRNLRDPRRRLRVGFVSPDFRHHAVAYFIEPIFANCDRSQLEIYCYAEVKREDDYTDRFRGLADHWHSTVGQSDEAVAQMIHEHEIDILVDLAGHSAGNRLRVFARKPAPVQVTYLGYPATTGLGAMDYRITDRHVDPEGASDLCYVERLARLPDSLWCYRPADGMPPVSPLPALARGHLTFGSFNNANKIDLATLDLWAGLMRALPGARLAFFAVPEGSLRERLFHAFGERGIDAGRLEIYGVMPPAAFHRMYGEVDVALDPVNINGGTTTCEALWMGVPVISLTGRRFLSRAGLSLLTTVGMADFAVASADGYIHLAAHLAGNLPLLAEIRAGLRAHVAASPLTDEASFTRNMEAVFRRMWEDWCAASGGTGVAEPVLRVAEQETAEERSQLFNLFNAGRYGEMESLARRLIERYPESGLAWKGLSVALQAQGQEALAELRRTVELLPEDADAHNNLGNALRNGRRFEAAQASYRRALEINPNFADAHNNQGNVLKDLGRLGDAVVSYRRALEISPDFAGAHNNLGNALKDLGQFDAALESYHKALALKPDFAGAYNNLGDALTCIGRLDEALANCRRALEIAPGYAAAHYNLGNALREAGEFDEALSSYGKALELRPDYVEAYTNQGSILKDLGRLDEAAASYRHALEINPCFAEAHNNLGNVLKDLGRVDEAMASYRLALKFNPGFAEVYSNLLFSLNYYPELHDDEIFSVCREYDRRFAIWDGQRHLNDASPERRLRIGYVSPDFRRHAVAYFAEPILAKHDRTQVEIYCYAEVRREDDYTERFRGLSDHWHSTVGLSDEAVERLIREHRIDILVDLAGHTRGNRLPVFGRKPAPVQLTYLGYAGSAGLSTVDYRLTDRYTDPEGEAESRYIEKLLRLPDSLWCYRPGPDMPEVTPLPALGRGFLTFGSFNNFNKIDRDTLVLWAALLRTIPDSRLMMLTVPEGEGQQRLLREFASLGVEAGRLDLLGPMPMDAFHRQCLEADIALDPINVNGGTTTCEALWMGLPVISLTGKRFLSRAGLSILSTVGMADFAAATAEGYIHVAAYLDGNRELLAELRAGLRGHVAGSMLTDEVKFACNLENLYREAWRKWCGSNHRGGKERYEEPNR